MQFLWQVAGRCARIPQDCLFDNVKPQSVWTYCGDVRAKCTLFLLNVVKEMSPLFFLREQCEWIVVLIRRKKKLFVYPLRCSVQTYVSAIFYPLTDVRCDTKLFMREKPVWKKHKYKTFPSRLMGTAYLNTLPPLWKLSTTLFPVQLASWPIFSKNKFLVRIGLLLSLTIDRQKAERAILCKTDLR